MKGQLRKTVICFVATVCIFGFTNLALGAAYETHEQIPGSPVTDDFPTFLNQLYTFGVGSAAILAMIMIGAGAFIYIVTSAGNASKMANGKDIIYSSLYGLLIAMIAWLILFVINPDFTSSSMETVPPVRDCINNAGCGL